MRKRSTISAGAVLTGVMMHMFCCIIPTALMAVNVAFGTTLALEITLFDHDAADVILWFSGAAVLVTFVLQRFDKPSRLEKIVLYVTAALFFAGLALHMAAHDHPSVG